MKPDAFVKLHEDRLQRLSATCRGSDLLLGGRLKI